MKIKTTADLR